MPGVNRFKQRDRTSLMEHVAKSSGGTCVFVSHQYTDLALAIKVGEALRTLEIDIWLDAEDASTRRAAAINDEQKLAEAIEWGLINCTHLLALISHETRRSWWVPYEIGSVRGRGKPLAFFVHRDVQDLPGYLTFGRTILDQSDFYEWASSVSLAGVKTDVRILIEKMTPGNSLSNLLPESRTS